MQLPHPELLGHVAVADDGAGNQLGEQGDIGGEVHKAPGGRAVLPVDVDDVAHGLEGVEADADGQGDGHRGQPGEGRDQPQRVQHQAGVLKEGQGPQVQHHGGGQQSLPAPAGPGALQEQAGGIVDGHGGQHQQHIDRFAVGVEDQIHQQQEAVAQAEIPAGNQKIAQQRYRQEDEEKGNAGKYHGDPPKKGRVR